MPRKSAFMAGYRGIYKLAKGEIPAPITGWLKKRLFWPIFDALPLGIIGRANGRFLRHLVFETVHWLVVEAVNYNWLLRKPAILARYSGTSYNVDIVQCNFVQHWELFNVVQGHFTLYNVDFSTLYEAKFYEPSFVECWYMMKANIVRSQPHRMLKVNVVRSQPRTTLKANIVRINFITYYL